MPRVDISNAFSGANQAQKIYQLTNRVEELEAEIMQLKSVNPDIEDRSVLEFRIQELIQELTLREGVQDVAIDLMDRNPLQPRQTFPQASIKAFAEILKNEGQLSPVILIPQNNGRYLLLDGERRWRAAPHAGWQTLKAVIKPAETSFNSDELRRQALSTTLHREDLHPLDLAECLISQIVYLHPELEEQQEEIPRILGTAVRRLERSSRLSALTEVTIAPKEIQQEWLESVEFKSVEERWIFEVLLGLQLNPTSVDSNVLPMLKLFEDVKQVIRDEGLDASKARLVNQLSSTQLNVDVKKALRVRTKASQQVLQEKLSVSQTRSLVREIIRQHRTADVSTEEPKENRLIQSIRSIDTRSIQPDDLTALHQALKEKLQEVEQLIRAR